MKLPRQLIVKIAKAIGVKLLRQFVAKIAVAVGCCNYQENLLGKKPRQGVVASSKAMDCWNSQGNGCLQSPRQEVDKSLGLWYVQVSKTVVC